MSSSQPDRSARCALVAVAPLALFCACASANLTGPSEPTNCTGAVYPEPSTSPYVLPYAVGTSRFLSQSNCDGFHNELDWFGYDFDMPIGTQVLAARAGSVTWVLEQYADGDHEFLHSNVLEITHDDGTKAHYVHLTRNGALVEVGDRVEQGQLIGLSGFTGMTGPRAHLHFIVFEFINASGRKSLPVTFRNVREPQPLVAGRRYEALPR